MANIFQWESVYITSQDVKDSTSKTALAALTDLEIETLIYKAQIAIDNYIVSYGTPYDTDQDFIFPVIGTDSNSLLPSDITMSALLSVEQIYENGDLITGSTTVTGTWAVKSEKVWDRSVTYDLWTTTTDVSDNESLWLPDQAINLLKKYKQVFSKAKL